MMVKDMFKRFSLFASALVALMLVSVNVQAQEVDPYQLVQEVAQKTFDRIKAERKDIEKKPDLLRDIVEQELLPHVDYKFAALKVLGKYFRSVPREKVPEYIQVFREYLIATYAVALSYYDKQEVIFEPTRDVDDDKSSVVVRAIIRDGQRPDIKIAFKVRKNDKTNEWKAYDMVAEGISVLSSKQSEFESIIRQQGIQAVIDIMKEKVAQPVVLQDGPEEKK